MPTPTSAATPHAGPRHRAQQIPTSHTPHILHIHVGRGIYEEKANKTSTKSLNINLISRQRLAEKLETVTPDSPAVSHRSRGSGAPVGKAPGRVPPGWPTHGAEDA